MNFYNDNDPKACAWLRELIARGILPPGHVDGRSILDLKPQDLDGYTQVHLFAGIGGWPFALSLAGWPPDRPAFTFSCPCQPLSCAGQRKGHADERHLWPAVYDLITQRQPATLFGEQVASPDGREWFAGVRADLEGAGYACGCANLPAASVGAPHRRERLFFVAHAGRAGDERGSRPGQAHGEAGETQEEAPKRKWRGTNSGSSSESCGTGVALGDTEPRRRQQCDAQERGVSESHEAGAGCRVGPVANAQHDGGRTDEQGRRQEGRGADGGIGGMGDSECDRLRTGRGLATIESNESGYWSLFDIIPCRDGKARRIESGTFPLAHGIPARMGRLRGYGNAICPQVAAKFIQAFCQTQGLAP